MKNYKKKKNVSSIQTNSEENSDFISMMQNAVKCKTSQFMKSLWEERQKCV